MVHRLRPTRASVWRRRGSRRRQGLYLAVWLLIAVFLGSAWSLWNTRLAGPAEAAAGGLSGEPDWITDGDTFRLSGERIRLSGIDAPEMETAAGTQARSHLVALIGEGPVHCRDTGERSYGRMVAVCAGPDGRDLADQMVSDGWAVDLPRFSGGRYTPAETAARFAGRGMHAP